MPENKEKTMKQLRIMLLIVALATAGGPSMPARAEANDPALAHAISGAKATLETGLKASEREGRPISAKFEVEDGKLQLSVYTIKDGGLAEVVLDPATGAIAETEKITTGDDLKDATTQAAAMANAKLSLLAAIEAATKANAGFRAVSIVPELRNGRPVGVITLLQGDTFKEVSAPLD
jgi:hypothetical protein